MFNHSQHSLFAHKNHRNVHCKILFYLRMLSFSLECKVLKFKLILQTTNWFTRNEGPFEHIILVVTTLNLLCCSTLSISHFFQNFYEINILWGQYYLFLSRSIIFIFKIPISFTQIWMTSWFSKTFYTIISNKIHNDISINQIMFSFLLE